MVGVLPEEVSDMVNKVYKGHWPTQSEVDALYNRAKRVTNDPTSTAYGRGGKRKIDGKYYYFIAEIAPTLLTKTKWHIMVMAAYGYFARIIGGKYLFARKKR